MAAAANGGVSLPNGDQPSVPGVPEPPVEYQVEKILDDRVSDMCRF